MIGRTNSLIGASGGGNSQQLVNYTMLYDAGNECTEITGGWTYYPLPYQSQAYTINNNAVKNADNIYFPTPGNVSTSCHLYTKNKIPVGYSVLGCVKKVNTLLYETGGWCSLLYNTSTYPNTSTKNVFFHGTTLSCETVDISDVTGDFHVCVGTCNNRSFNLYNLFLVKEDNWQEWIAQADFANYASLEDVIGNSDALEILLNNEKAVKYMLAKCTGTVMASIIQSETALGILADSKYISSILGNVHWKKFLDMVGFKPRTYLYNEGDECTDLTGGWGSMGIKSSAWTGGVSTAPTITKNSESIYATTLSGKIGITCCLKRVPFDNYNKLCAEIDGYTAAYSSMQLDVYNTLTPTYCEEIVASCGVGSKTTSSVAETISKCTVELDISNVTDDCMVAFKHTSETRLNIYKVWLE